MGIRVSLPRPAEPGDAVATVDRSFRLMGTHMRLVIGAPAAAGLPAAEDRADEIIAMLEAYNAALSRFRPDSQLCALNADPREVVPASDLLREAVRVALDAAERTGGIVDPTILPALEAAGYTASWDPSRRLDLREALAAGPDLARPARVDDGARWRAVRVDDVAGTITRPPGLRLDTGGTGKGHAADRAAAMLAGYDMWAVDCGGDLRIGGAAGLVRDVEVEHPFTGEVADVVRVRDGAVATSGLRSRIWRRDDGGVAHHLLDPATGEPAFTGLVAVTALAPSAVEAETLAKAALLAGPRGARSVLARHGGIAIAQDGAIDRVGRLEPPPRVTFRMTTPRSPR